MYFTAPTYTKDQLQTEYKILCKKLHPDRKTGNETEFKLMKAEHDKIKKVIDNSFDGVWFRPVPKPRVVPVSNKSAYPVNITGQDVEKFFEALNIISDLAKKVKKKK